MLTHEEPGEQTPACAAARGLREELDYRKMLVMGEFISERVDVEKAETSPRPVRFTWRGQEHEVVAVLREWVDTSFGGLGPRSRKWYNRRHRRHYVVKDAEGRVFEMYLDYANRKKPTWWLLERLA